VDNDRWHLIEAIFHRALDHPLEEREMFVREACTGDDALFREVMELLDADGSPHSLLRGHAIDAVDVPPATLPPGTIVGSYRVIESIGTGGMGAVYLAERADGQFEQRVALKLIKRGMDSDTILARFQSERQILARLHHPNIARLTDGGLTGDGLPYFTMEYVDGRPITQYCDEQRLSIEDRLDLFQDVCAAVQYAHTNLVVHRDLKPSNILVTGDGVVKLLDFGIARVLGEEAPELTRSGQRVMTPAYASPEQIRGEPVTTASDVYSLGVVLYELLCGRHPHRDTTSTPAELERAIADTPAERPSRFLTRIGPADAGEPALRDTIARARQLPPMRLRKRLEGDLDTMCLVALRKEPERRYASAGQLLEDIRFHLAGRPVSARPDTVRYRFEKFVRRNRIGVGAALALVVLVAALTVIYTTRLAHERDRARLEAQKAAEVSTFLGSLFEAADPYQSRGKSITARDLLDRGRDRVHAELADQPDVLADMLTTIGKAYGNLAVYDEARKALLESLDLRRTLGTETDADAVETMTVLASFENEMGLYKEAEERGHKSIETARKLPDREHLATALSTLATTVDYQGRFDEAEKYFRESIKESRAAEGPKSKEASVVMNNLALLLHEESRYAEADSLYREALAIQEATYGKRHPETSTTRYNYAQLLGDEGRLDDAKAMWAEVLETDRDLYPGGHPYIAFSLSAYGKLLSRIGEFTEAEALQREALDIRRTFHGDEHPDVAYSLGALGRVLYEEGHYDEAEKDYREALAMHRKVNGPKHPVLGAVMNDIGQLQYARGDYEAADTMLHRSLEFQRSLAGDEERNAMAVSMVRRAAVLAARGRLLQAESLAREGVSISERLHSDQGLWVAGAMVQLGDVRLQMHAVDEAETLYTNALARMRSFEAGAPPRPRDTPALLGLGRCRLERKDYAGAEARFREALDIDRRYLGDDHLRVACEETALARVFLARGEAADARPLLEHAVAVYQKRVLPEQIDRREAERLLKECRAALKKGR
jgi:serine/threonine-protein kinase